MSSGPRAGDDAVNRLGDSEPTKRLIRTMVLIRRFDEVALEARKEGRAFGTMHPYIGQEAIAVGVCAALRPSDRIVSNHRGHGHSIAKGASPNRMMAELFGRATGYCKGKGGSMHIADFSIGMLGANGIVGAGLPIAVGSALAAQLTGGDQVTVAFFGDGATGQGVFHESLNLSAIWQLPVVWVCENNHYSVDTRLEEVLPSTEVHHLAAGYQIPALSVDGNDVFAVAAAAKEAVDRARSGGGPTLVEASTYRWGVHSQRAAITLDNRPAAEIAGWRNKDPITIAADALRGRGVLDDREFAAIIASVDEEIEAAVRYATESPFPPPEDALNDLWAEERA